MVYAISQNTMVLCGDPVCKEKDFPAFLADYTLQGGKVAKVRAAVNRARKAGLRAEEYGPREKRQIGIGQAFQEITKAWL